MKHSSVHENQYLFLSQREWLIAVFVSSASGLAVFLATSDISPWPAIVTALALLTTFHMVFSSRLIVALPHIAILIATLQYVFGAWLAFYFPPNDPTYDIGARLPIYLSYAGPVVVALVLGWASALVRLRPARQSSGGVTSGLSIELDLLLVIGFLGSVAGRFIDIPSLNFVFLLLGNLRYVGVFGRMILKGPGWGWRLALVLGTQAVFAAGSAMFHDLLLWSAWSFALWIYVFRPKPQLILAVVALGVLSLPALQEAKWRVRSPLDDDPLAQGAIAGEEPDRLQQTVNWLQYLVPAFGHTLTGNLDPDFLGSTAARYNQGWIVNRVMGVVPEVEPYARGETLKDAAVAALLPRVIAPNKEIAGGREEMLQYANMDIGDTTAMTLGFAGEMYANFGLLGGVIGCGVYALVFGLMFRWFCVRAFRHPLWWSLVPFVFYAALKAEDDVAFVLNWTVKAAVVVAAVVFVLPNFRRSLFPSPQPLRTKGSIGSVAIASATSTRRRP